MTEETKVADGASSGVSDSTQLLCALKSSEKEAVETLKSLWLRACETILEVERERDEWKQEHENLLEVRRQDLAAMQARIDNLQRMLARYMSKEDDEPGRLMFGA